ncbi:unnamed protein product [Closterium sp. NIES-64]|nr:unnamed protein product [Closterium sp. NIES-64]
MERRLLDRLDDVEKELRRSRAGSASPSAPRAAPVVPLSALLPHNPFGSPARSERPLPAGMGFVGAGGGPPWAQCAPLRPLPAPRDLALSSHRARASALLPPMKEVPTATLARLWSLAASLQSLERILEESFDSMPKQLPFSLPSCRHSSPLPSRLPHSNLAFLSSIPPLSCPHLSRAPTSLVPPPLSCPHSVRAPPAPFPGPYRLSLHLLFSNACQTRTALSKAYNQGFQKWVFCAEKPSHPVIFPHPRTACHHTTACPCMHHPPSLRACTTRRHSVHAPPAVTPCMHHPPSLRACTTRRHSVHAPTAVTPCMHQPPSLRACTNRRHSVHAPTAVTPCMHQPPSLRACTTRRHSVHAPPTATLCSYHLVALRKLQVTSPQPYFPDALREGLPWCTPALLRSSGNEGYWKDQQWRPHACRLKSVQPAGVLRCFHRKQRVLLMDLPSHVMPCGACAVLCTRSFVTPSFVTPSFVMPSFVTPSFVTPSFVTPSFVTPSFVMPSFVTPSFVTPSFVTPSFVTPSFVTPSFVTPSFVTPSFVTPSFVTPSFVTPSFVTPSFVTPSFVTPSFVMPSFVTPSFVTPSFVTPSFVTPSFVTPSFVTPSFVTPSFVTPSFVMPSFVTPSFVTPSFVTPSFVTPSFVTPPSYGRRLRDALPLWLPPGKPCGACLILYVESVCRCACLPVCLSAGAPVCRCACLPVCLSAGVPVCLSACLPVCLSACLPVFLSACLPVCLSSCLPVFLSACLPVFLSACLPVFLSACVRPHLPWKRLPRVPCFSPLSDFFFETMCAHISSAQGAHGLHGFPQGVHGFHGFPQVWSPFDESVGSGSEKVLRMRVSRTDYTTFYYGSLYDGFVRTRWGWHEVGLARGESWHEVSRVVSRLKTRSAAPPVAPPRFNITRDGRAFEFNLTYVAQMGAVQEVLPAWMFNTSLLGDDVLSRPDTPFRLVAFGASLHDLTTLNSTLDYRRTATVHPLPASHLLLSRVCVRAARRLFLSLPSHVLCAVRPMILSLPSHVLCAVRPMILSLPSHVLCAVRPMILSLPSHVLCAVRPMILSLPSHVLCAVRPMILSLPSHVLCAVRPMILSLPSHVLCAVRPMILSLPSHVLCAVRPMILSLPSHVLCAVRPMILSLPSHVLCAVRPMILSLPSHVLCAVAPHDPLLALSCALCCAPHDPLLALSCALCCAPHDPLLALSCALCCAPHDPLLALSASHLLPSLRRRLQDARQVTFFGPWAAREDIKPRWVINKSNNVRGIAFEEEASRSVALQGKFS